MVQKNKDDGNMNAKSRVIYLFSTNINMKWEIEQKYKWITATWMLDPGLYLTQHMFAFISMLRTLLSCFVHQTLTCNWSKVKYAKGSEQLESNPGDKTWTWRKKISVINLE